LVATAKEEGERRKEVSWRRTRRGGRRVFEEEGEERDEMVATAMGGGREDLNERG